MTPGVPPDRVKFMQDAFDKIFHDAAFVKQAKRVWPIWSEVKGPEEFLETARAAAALPKASIDALKQEIQSMVK